MKKIFILIISVLFLVTNLTFALSEETVNDIVERLQGRYDKTIDFSAIFTQETMTKLLGVPAIVNGKVYFKKPGMMRWKYTDPITHEIITDGETLWYYFPEEKQVRIYKTAEALESELFLGFLFGKGKLTDDFEVALGGPELDISEDYFILMLAPKDPDTVIERIILLVDKEEYLVNQINTYDILGNVSRIAFEEISLDTGLKNSLFHFIVPSGVETIKIEGELAGPPETDVEVEIIERDD